MDISKHSRYKAFVWATKLHRLGLELLGLWPRSGEAVKYKFVSDLRLSVALIMMTMLFVHLTWALVRVWGNMILMIENLQFTIPVMVVLLKLVAMRCKQTTISHIIKMMAEDWIYTRVDAERNVMIRQAQITRLIVICAYVWLFLTNIIILVSAAFGVHYRSVTNLVDRDRILPLQTYYFYNTDKSPIFQLTFLVQAVTMFLCAISFTSVDMFLGLVVFHICGQLENFRHRLVNLISCKDFDSALRNNVKSHLRLTRFASNIEDTFSIMLLGLVVYFGIVFCLYGFLLLAVMNDEINNMSFSRICFAVSGMIIIITHAFLYYSVGELLEQKCEAVYLNVCNLEWYKLEPRKARNLIILMIRIQKPFRISAGKIFPLTMATFCSLLKTSAGYISFLLAKREI